MARRVVRKEIVVATQKMIVERRGEKMKMEDQDSGGLDNVMTDCHGSHERSARRRKLPPWRLVVASHDKRGTDTRSGRSLDVAAAELVKKTERKIKADRSGGTVKTRKTSRLRENTGTEGQFGSLLKG